MCNYIDIHAEAMRVADEVASDFFKKNGESACCGFAWVEIYDCNKNPNRAFVKALSKANIATKKYTGGYYIGVPAYDLPSCGWSYKQCVLIKEEACRAYAKVLRLYNINASMCSRVD